MANYPQAWEAEHVFPGAPSPKLGTQQGPGKSILINKADISQSHKAEPRPVNKRTLE